MTLTVSNKELQYREGLRYLKSGNVEDAQHILLNLLKGTPNNPVLLEKIGYCCAVQNKHKEAYSYFSQAVHQDPRHCNSLLNFAIQYIQYQDTKQSEIVDFNLPLNACKQCFELCQGGLDQSLGAARILAGVKNADFLQMCFELSKVYQIHDIFRCMISGCLSFMDSQFEKAQEYYEIASSHAPGDGLIYTELAKVFYHLNQRENALKASFRSVELYNDSARAWYWHSVLLHNCRLSEEGLAANLKAIDLQPNDPYYQVGLGIQYLRLGDWEKGWTLYTHRLNLGNDSTIEYVPPVPKWENEPLDEIELILCCEQGFGDVIQFARFVPLVATKAKRVLFNCQRKIAHLFEHFQDIHNVEIVKEGTGFYVNSKAMRWCPLVDIPHKLGVPESEWSKSVPYIYSGGKQAEKWRNCFNEFGDGKLKVGIAWQGNPLQSVDIGRSIPLQMFQPLSQIKNVQFVSLQKLHGLDQLESIDFADKIHVLDNFDNGDDAFADTIHIIQALDLIITSDTSIAHLAGALGRPVWLGLKFAPEWRWQFDREDSPWYPTMRLFRQKKMGDWESVMQSILGNLKHLVDS
ncbi:MAG: tetratricopeptide repeat protein [Pseudomonadota bacterium]